jgi:cysteine desulfurase/selenocysteine lyase
MTYDVEKVRRDFPILSREIHGKPLVYLDSSASAQKPRAVIDAVTESYAQNYANVHRGLHTLSSISTDQYESVRGKLKRFLGAAKEEQIIFTRGATEAINLAASAFLEPRIKPGDEIILSVMEHHANIVPWHFMRERHGAKLIWVEPDVRGDVSAAAVIDAITEKTKFIAITHMSNVLGSVVDVKAIAQVARDRDIPVLVDGSQAAVHMPVNVCDLGIDFYAVTGHKLYGPSGCGALYARSARLTQMRPWHGGGNMIRDVTRDVVTYNDPPHKFEAGTPPITQFIGFGAAIDYLTTIGMGAIAAHERSLRDYAQSRLDGLNWLTTHGHSETKGAIFSFVMDGAHPHDISTIVDRKGVAVRAGHHCAQPLMRHLGVTATTRASFAMYNTHSEIDIFVDALETCRDMFF